MTTCPSRGLSESLAGRALVLRATAKGRALTVTAGEPSRTDGAANLTAAFISKVAPRLEELEHAVTRIGNHPDFHDAMPTGLHGGGMPSASTIAPDECHGIVPMMSEIGLGGARTSSSKVGLGLWNGRPERVRGRAPAPARA